MPPGDEIILADEVVVDVWLRVRTPAHLRLIACKLSLEVVHAITAYVLPAHAPSTLQHAIAALKCSVSHSCRCQQFGKGTSNTIITGDATARRLYSVTHFIEQLS